MFELRDILDSGIVPVILGGLAFALAVRLLAGLLDHWRIGNYIRQRGGDLTVCRWWPFGPGWLGEKRDRIYYVVYADGQGHEHRAYCKTSLLTGVYFTQDRLIQPASGVRKDPSHAALVEENARLREENRALREALVVRQSPANSTAEQASSGTR